MPDHITIADRSYTRVRDLRTIPVGARLMQRWPNHTTDFLTVREPYGQYDKYLWGVVCYVDCGDRPGWKTLLTQTSLEGASVWQEDV